MATTPTDDPLANGDRTVGVHASQGKVIKALKREARLFDQIAIPNVDINVVRSRDELDWLRDIGIVREIPIILTELLG